MKPGDIVILPFPFTDLSAQKVRPAVILSNMDYNQAHQNVIVAGIYGREKLYSVTLNNQDLVNQKLNKPSFMSLQNVFTIDRKLIRQTVDHLNADKRKELLRVFKDCF